MRGKESESGKETVGRWKWMIGRQGERDGVSRLILTEQAQWYSIDRLDLLVNLHGGSVLWFLLKR